DTDDEGADDDDGGDAEGAAATLWPAVRRMRVFAGSGRGHGLHCPSPPRPRRQRPIYQRGRRPYDDSMDPQRTTSISEVSARLNSIHAAMYFSPTVGAEYAKYGLEPGVEGNLAARCAPLGRVSPGVVSACYYNYSPKFIADALPGVWERVSPEQMVRARFNTVAAYMDELFGDRDDIALLTEAATQLSEGLEPVLAAMDFAGRPLASATADTIGRHR